MKKSLPLIFLISLTLLISSASSKSAIVSVKRVFEELNKARTDPGSYATMIQNDIKAHIVNCVHTQWNLEYVECNVAIDEAITFL
jgi:Skp family chaperone for outer membrane proteins